MDLVIRQSSSALLANTHITRIKDYVKFLQKKDRKKYFARTYFWELVDFRFFAGEIFAKLAKTRKTREN